MLERQKYAVGIRYAHVKADISAGLAVPIDVVRAHDRLRLLTTPVGGVFFGSTLLVFLILDSGGLGLDSPRRRSSESSTP